jgi:hypothetical protein
LSFGDSTFIGERDIALRYGQFIKQIH